MTGGCLEHKTVLLASFFVTRRRGHAMMARFFAGLQERNGKRGRLSMSSEAMQ